jgi:hypothetical protein
VHDIHGGPIGVCAKPGGSQSLTRLRCRQTPGRCLVAAAAGGGRSAAGGLAAVRGAAARLAALAVVVAQAMEERVQAARLLAARFAASRLAASRGRGRSAAGGGRSATRGLAAARLAALVAMAAKRAGILDAGNGQNGQHKQGRQNLTLHERASKKPGVTMGRICRSFRSAKRRYRPLRQNCEVGQADFRRRHVCAAQRTCRARGECRQKRPLARVESLTNAHGPQNRAFQAAARRPWYHWAVPLCNWRSTQCTGKIPATMWAGLRWR